MVYYTKSAIRVQSNISNAIKVERGLRICEHKSKYMKIGDKAVTDNSLWVKISANRMVNFKNVNNFVYLYSLITENSDNNTEIEAIIVRGSKSARSLMSVLK